MVKVSSGEKINPARSGELDRVRPITSQLKIAIELPIEGNIDRELGNLAFNDSY